MGRLGDSSGLIVWAMYARWPLFAVGAAAMGLFLGLAFVGLIGGIIGLVAGGMVGFIIGSAMGVDRSKFPVYLIKWAAYGGGVPSYEGKYPARVITQSFGEGETFVERRIVEYLQGTTLRQLPNYSLPVWYRQEDNRNLMVLQIDTFTYLPIQWEKGVLVARNVPVYKTDEQGRPFTDDKGEYVLEMDEQGKPLETKTVVFDTNIQLEDGHAVPISKGLAAKLDNERVSYTQAYRIATTFNRTGDFWQKYGHLLVSLFAILAMLIIAVFAYIKYAEVADKVASSTNAAVLQATAVNERTSILNAQVAAALLKAGFNVNQTFCVQQNNAPPTGGGASLDLPVLGRVGG